MTSAIVTSITIVAIFFFINILRGKFPISDTSGYTKTDLPVLRKKYAAITTIGLLINVIIFLGGVFFTLWIWGKYKISPWIGMAIPFLLLGVVPWFEMKFLLNKKDDEWKKGFKAYLDLSYNMDYFSSIRILSLVSILISLVLIIVGSYKTFNL